MDNTEITKTDIEGIINTLQKMVIEKGYISHYDGISFDEYMKDVICCLHTFKRQDRYDELQIQLQKQGVKKVIYFEGETFKHSPKKGICRGHKRIVQFAKDHHLSRIIIAENDLCFMGEQKGAWQYFLDNIPSNYDTYSALAYVGNIENNRIVSQASGWHTLYVVHERFYDFFLSIPDDVHLDRELSKHWEQFKFMVSPLVCAQQSGSFSDNSKRKCDYTPYLEGRDLYK